MAARLVWCLHRDCRVGFAAGEELPPYCPACDQPAHWSTEAPFPLLPWMLTKYDYALLKALKIAEK